MKISEDKEIEKAIVFLVQKIEESGNNPKPVILHSIRVGIFLLERGYSKEIVIAGLLHDVVEDSDTSFVEIEERFGKKVRKLIASLTFNRNISDKKERFLDNLERIKNTGIEVIIVKVADFIENSYFYHLAKSKEDYEFLRYKISYFANEFEDVLKDEPIWEDLNRQINIVNNYKFNHEN